MNKKAKCSGKVRSLLCILTVFILSGTLNAGAQENVQITLRLDDVPLGTAIKHIEEQSPYLFMNNGVDLSRTVSLSVTDRTISEVCNTLFTPLDIDFRIDRHHIYISDKPAPVPVAISGRISDESGLPVPGAAVIESGTSNGTVTDSGGLFALTVNRQQR